MPRDPFRQKWGLDHPFTWTGLVVIGIGVLITAAIMYTLNHVKFG